MITELGLCLGFRLSIRSHDGISKEPIGWSHRKFHDLLSSIWS
jgi:hypothetical protein